MNKKELAEKIRNASGFSNDEKAALLELVNRTKKYGLVWENKPEDVHEQLRTHIPVLKEVKEKAVVYDPGDEPSQTQAKENELFAPGDELDQPQNISQKIPNHIIIESDNLHALVALQYSHAGKIDLIYIDPPYNTGAKDWKYNNAFVDESDLWRHSNWCSFMYKRLRLAKTLLRKDGVLICTIDENELADLGLLLKEVFPAHKIVCVTIIHNPNGIQGSNFSNTNEFAFFVFPDKGSFINRQDRKDNPDIRPLRNVSKGAHLRQDAANCFYPIFIKDNEVVAFGEVSPDHFHPEGANIFQQDGTIAVYPIDPKGIERKWVFARQSVESIKDELFVTFNKKRGIYDVMRKKSKFTYKTVWDDPKFNANIYGTQLINDILRTDFPFPKSLHAVKECISAIKTSSDEPIILDFFAGSGTTLHAVMTINLEDGGNRQCILVTNNENNICEEVTYERNKRVIQGYTTPKGNRVEGLRKNNLRYFKTELLDREENLKNFRELTRQSTDLLRIKEDCYDEVPLLQFSPEITRLFENDKIYMMIIYDDRYIDECIPVLKDLEKKTKVYVFAYGQYPYTDDFEEVLDKIELCAIPDAIYEAYQSALPPKKAPLTAEEEPDGEEQVETMFGEEE